MKAASMLLLSLALLVVARPCSAERTVTDRSLYAFWTQFQVGDSSIDVYESLRRLILAFTHEDRRSTILQWNSSSNEFTLFVRNVEISDLVTGSDAQGRPTFAGSFDAQGVAHVTGFVDVAPDGELVVQIATAPNTVQATLYSTEEDGSVGFDSYLECKCDGMATAICAAQDCHDLDPCTGGDGVVKCKWL
ncbi:MAG: hypothetical protein L0219_09820 [Phycisphaerales bacterium]|nr:hypothetical protein [Phycisphaerales bacterium]